MIILWDQWLDRYKWGVVTGLIGVIALGLGVFLYRSQPESPTIQVLSAQDTEAVTDQGYSFVDVSGAVNSPGLYKLSAESRVEDALQAAGGITNKVDYKWIDIHLNRAEKIRDGMKIYIPALNEVIISETAENIINANAKINLNSASLQDLESLKGIGPVTAQKIINNRPYTKVEDLTTKKIIGIKVFEQIKDELVAW